MGMRIKVDISDLSKKLGVTQQTLHRGLVEGIAEGLFEVSRRSFQEQRSPEGVPWAPLSPGYSQVKARLFPGRPILQRTRWLFRSLFREAQGNLAIVGSNVAYAPFPQVGTSKMPARPYLPSPETAEREAQRLGEEIVEDAIRRSEGAA